jgi:hypothetical protein
MFENLVGPSDPRFEGQLTYFWFGFVFCNCVWYVNAHSYSFLAVGLTHTHTHTLILSLSFFLAFSFFLSLSFFFPSPSPLSIELLLVHRLSKSLLKSQVCCPLAFGFRCLGRHRGEPESAQAQDLHLLISACFRSWDVIEETMTVQDGITMIIVFI